MRLATTFASPAPVVAGNVPAENGTDLVSQWAAPRHAAERSRGAATEENSRYAQQAAYLDRVNYRKMFKQHKGNARAPGADLAPLMLLMAHAYSLRQKARQSLQQGDARTALTLAQAAQNLHATPEGRLLHAVCSVAARAVIRQNSSGPWNE